MFEFKIRIDNGVYNFDRFHIDLIGIGSMDAMRPDTGFSTQDIVGLLVAAVMGALYFLSAEEELDWEALLGDDDDDEEE